MPKPIPVFQFVFAAYAATCAGRASQPPLWRRAPRLGSDASVADSPRDAVPAYRNLPSIDPRELIVKISVVDEYFASAAHALSLGAPVADNVEDLWLGEIEETPAGYSGVVLVDPARLLRVRTGDSVAFGPMHILDWKYAEGSQTRGDALAAAGGSHDGRQMSQT